MFLVPVPPPSWAPCASALGVELSQDSFSCPRGRKGFSPPHSPSLGSKGPQGLLPLSRSLRGHGRQVSLHTFPLGVADPLLCACVALSEAVSDLPPRLGLSHE